MINHKNLTFEVMNLFYARLSELCKENGTSITAFAISKGCSRSAPYGWKKGSSPSADIVIKAAQHFSVTTDYLLGLSDDPVRTGEVLTSDEVNLVNAFRAADPALRTAALAVLKTATPKTQEKAAKLSASQNSDLLDAL